MPYNLAGVEAIRDVIADPRFHRVVQHQNLLATRQLRRFLATLVVVLLSVFVKHLCLLHEYGGALRTHDFPFRVEIDADYHWLAQLRHTFTLYVLVKPITFDLYVPVRVEKNGLFPARGCGRGGE